MKNTKNTTKKNTTKTAADARAQIIVTRTEADARARYRLKVNNRVIALIQPGKRSTVVYIATAVCNDIAVIEKRFTAKNTAKTIRATRAVINSAYKTAVEHGATNAFYAKLDFTSADYDINAVETALLSLANVKQTADSTTAKQTADAQTADA